MPSGREDPQDATGASNEVSGGRSLDRGRLQLLWLLLVSPNGDSPDQRRLGVCLVGSASPGHLGQASKISGLVVRHVGLSGVLGRAIQHDGRRVFLWGAALVNS